MIQYIIIAAVVIIVGLAAYKSIVRARRGGGCCGDKPEKEAKLRSKDKSKSHYPYELRLQIGGMSCENCAIRVENALNAEENLMAKVNFHKKSARVLSKTPPDEAKIRSVVSKAGYALTEYELIEK